MRQLPLFSDRGQAGWQLGARLHRHAGQNVVVLGISAGGMEVAAEVAKALQGRLDVLVVHKLTFDRLPGLAFGATCSDGILYLDGRLSEHVPMDVIGEKLKCELRLAMAERQDLRGGLLPLTLAHRTVILVDEAVGGGDEMLAAVQSILRRRPETLVVAVPVCAAPAWEQLSKVADELVSLHVTHDYKAASAYYSVLPPVTRARVKELLNT